MAAIYLLLSILAAFAGLVIFCLLRRVRREKLKRRGSEEDLDLGQPELGEEVEELPESVLKSFTFWAGGLAGVVSAAATHQLDVAKTLRHVGKPMPEHFGDYFVGIAMGSFAQGFRFAITLILNMTLQKKLDKFQKDAERRAGRCSWLISFMMSMLAAGTGEFLANPPVVIKNYQITNNVGIITACEELWEQGGLPRFFSGVGMGVLRKSLANGVVLQTIGPTKAFLQVAFPQMQTNKVMLSFCAGSLTGSFAEVITNPPDQVKTMTQAGVPFLPAVSMALHHPFRGAGFAGLRKGIIRGINWGGLAAFMAVFEWAYRKYVLVKTGRKRSISWNNKELESRTEFVRSVSQQAET